jgi:hypothetical protein
MDDHTVGVKGVNKRADAKYAYDAVFAPSISTEVSPTPRRRRNTAPPTTTAHTCSSALTPARLNLEAWNCPLLTCKTGYHGR